MDYHEILRKLRETKYEDIKYYIALAMYCVKLNSWILSVEKPNRENDEMFKVVVKRSRDPRNRDGVSIGIFYNCDGVVHTDPRYRCLNIYLEYIKTPPPPNIIGSSPIFAIPIHLFYDINIGMDKYRGVQLKPPFPEGSLINIVFPYNELHIAIKRFKFYEPYEEKPRVEYALWIENKEDNESQR